MCRKYSRKIIARQPMSKSVQFCPSSTPVCMHIREHLERINLSDVTECVVVDITLDNNAVNPISISEQCGPGSKLILLHRFGGNTPRLSRLRQRIMNFNNSLSVWFVEVGAVYGIKFLDVDLIIEDIRRTKKLKTLGPMIHIADLLSVIVNIINTKVTQPGVIDVVAIDNSRNVEDRLAEFLGIQPISEKPVPVVANKQTLHIQWQYEYGFLSSLPEFVKPIGVGVIVLGPPCSGKSDLARQISKSFNMCHLELEPMIRNAEAQANQAYNGKYHTFSEEETYCHRVIHGKRGKKRYPSDVVSAIVSLRIEKVDCQFFGFVLDGFPRTVTEINELVTRCRSFPSKIIVINLESVELETCLTHVKQKQAQQLDSLVPHDTEQEVKRRFANWANNKQELSERMNQLNWIVCSGFVQAKQRMSEMRLKNTETTNVTYNPHLLYLASQTELLRKLRKAIAIALSGNYQNPLEAIGSYLLETRE